jgi:hypothetical protein
MLKELLIKRIQELSNIVNESAANYQSIRTTLENATNNHNLILGRLSEVKELYEISEEREKEKETRRPVAKPLKSS